MARGDGPFKVLGKEGANAYKLELPGDTTISVNFNMGDLSPYVDDEVNYGNLRVDPFKRGEDDTFQDSL